MNIKRFLSAGMAGALLLTTTAVARAEEGARLPPIADKVAREECSACHMPYSAILLPKRSWRAIMGNLDNHFGEDASLDPKVTKQILAYLVANASDAGNQLPAITRGVSASETPLRISELPIMVSIHGGEVGARWRKKVGSMAKCNACHRGAENGYFGE